MPLEINSWKRFNGIFWSLNAVVILLSAHLLLWHGEPEGFFEIFQVEGYMAQYLVHVGAFSVLIMVVDRLHLIELRRHHVAGSRRRAGWFYFVKVFVVPALLALPFAYGYFWWFGAPLDLAIYLQRVFPFFLFFLLLANAVLFLRYLLRRLVLLQQAKRPVHVRMVTNISLTVPDPKRTPELANSEDRILEIFYKRKRIEVPLGQIVCAYAEKGSIKVNLRDGKTGRYPYSLVKLKAFVGDDDRFFSTGTWIVNGQDIEAIKDTYSRLKHIHLKVPFEDVLSLPKEKVSEFRQWYEQGILDGKVKSSIRE